MSKNLTRLQDEKVGKFSNFIPPEYDPHFAGTSFTGLKPESVPIASHLMLTSYSEDRFDILGEPVEFTNPFNAERETVLSDSYFEGFGPGGSFLYASSCSDSNFEEWMDYDK